MKAEKVMIPDFSGKNISAVVHYPYNDLHRLIILCPGNLDSKDYEHLVNLAQLFSEHGYTAVRFDPIGTWDSGGTESDYLTSNYLQNVRSVIEYMLARKSYGEILIGGHSRGGMISILYAAQDSRISTVIAIMPPSPITPEELLEKKYVEWKKNGFNISIRDVPGSTAEKRFRLPYAHLVERLKYDVTEEVQKVYAPIIFVAGELDKVVLPEDVKLIFDKANEPKRYILLQGIGHDYRHNLAEIKIVNEKILDEISSMRKLESGVEA